MKKIIQFRKNTDILTVAKIVLVMAAFNLTVLGQKTVAEQDKVDIIQLRDPQQTVNITALQAGSNHYKNGNPGLETNFTLFANLARKAASSVPKPDLICFPEYTISGWRYPAEEIINSIAEAIPGEGYWYKRYAALARETGIPLLGWLVESSEGKLYNTSFMLDGDGKYLGKYRKVQANLGEQTWWGWSQGEQFSLIELNGVKYGISICADMWFPETVRCEELSGANVILHVSIADDMGHLIPARAFDSKLPIIVSVFQGGSYAVDHEGKMLGKLAPEEPGWLTFPIRPFINHLGNKYGGVWDTKKGQHNIRNVGAYSILTDPSTRPPWTEVFMDDAGRSQTREQLLQRFNGRYDAHDPASPATELGIKGTQFTINGIPTFLYGISYYAGLGASEEFILKDLADIKEHGFNWIRLWANWNGFNNDVSAVDSIGNPREPFFMKLKWIVSECDRQGIIVDVSLTRGKDNAGPRLQTLDSHRRAVEAIVKLLKPYKNWYLDLANERDVKDQRFVSFEELKQLCETAKQIDSGLLVTASAGNDINRDDLREYLQTVHVDFICPHRPRNTGSIEQTQAKTLEYLAWMKEMGRMLPVNYQEPFRRGYTTWQPKAGDFVADLLNAKTGGAAGWCFHNGGQRDQVDEKPRRSFDMSEKRLFDQLDKDELEAIEIISAEPRHIGSFIKWQRVEIALPGPESEGRGEPNPFNITVDVIFTSPAGKQFIMPAFYDGDGRGGLDGSVWKVRFSADETGQWKFTSKSKNSKLNSYSGTFTVTASAKDSPHFYRWGRLESVATATNNIRYLKFREGPYWLKAGCDDPENFLGNLSNYDTNIKRREAVDYLSAKGINSLYIMTHTIDGDGKDVWPWFGQNAEEAKTNGVTGSRFDVAKLEEWRDLFEYMQVKGMVVYIVLEDDSGWKDYDHIRYYREMVARFGYLPALIFNFNEEYNENYSLPEALNLISQLKKLDPFNHPCGIHNVNTLNDDYIAASQIDFTSIQTGTAGETVAPGPLQYNQLVNDWINRCQSLTRRILMIGIDEGRPEEDRKVWWSTYMGGGVWEAHILGPYDRPMSAWATVWTELGGTRTFMESLPFWEMASDNSMVKSGYAFCLTKPGEIYAFYMPAGGSITIELPRRQNYSVEWWNPGNGKDGRFQNESLIKGGRSILVPPGTGDWAVRLFRKRQ
ncbi:MAG: nitrilase-related carbon-nitrogen hydrolase [Bacteroidales bacterium]|nr:nitrilase-related carbon-nitrogen hydrolase [Bacteroidales bacterium]